MTAWIEIHHECSCPLFRPGDETNFIVEVPESVNDMFAEGEEDESKTGFGRCPNCGVWVDLYNNADGDVSDPDGRHQGKWSLTVPEESTEIVVGCWVETERWGPAVVTEVSVPVIGIRYHAIRTHDQAEIWVANSENPWECTFLKEGDDLSRHVLTLEGPYGEGEIE